MSADLHFGRIERRQMRRVRNVFFVGIGGVGMSAIAEVLITLGYTVSGSDLKPSANTDRLAAKGGEAVFRSRGGECERRLCRRHLVGD